MSGNLIRPASVLTKGIGEKNLSSCSWTVANSASSIMDSKPGTRIGNSLRYCVLFSNYGDPGHAIFVAYIYRIQIEFVGLFECSIFVIFLGKCYAVVRNGYADFVFCLCFLYRTSGRLGHFRKDWSGLFTFFSLDESAMFSSLFHFSYCRIRLRN